MTNIRGLPLRNRRDMDRHPFSIENILKDTRGASRILKIAPTSEALALAERMAGNAYVP